ncbi:OLC1v1014053C1 [Oldenlandia corymbosa var. corymbosa]|uniref:OLC1v1014053C1 n=1 Tax=Oldenlandia corymbosa var. corymbosa TaxID=529605 RepID=A0AAV1E0N1_OLDCO|nr:OLC1v1014053C1 [Oldenlandia corymbosa var. corymbosa]
MDVDEEDFVFYGTPIEREEDITTRKKKAVAEASGQLRSVVPWKQEVRDEEGRRRFHGAFTGGYSAGYYNTVGSKEGWTPQSFTSSRKNRAEIKRQDIMNFLDDDEKEELDNRSLATSTQFDTFGFTAAELARQQVEKETKKRPSAIPGPIPDELIVPATESIGVKLLLKMGWRRGRSIKDSSATLLKDKEARKNFVASSADNKSAKSADSELVENDTEACSYSPTDDGGIPKSTPVYVINPKQDLHGLGYDPYKHAPEFRERKRARMLGTKETNPQKPFSVGDGLFGFKSGRIAPGFGIGALEDLDVEDEDVYAPGYDFEEFQIKEIEEPSRPMIENVKLLGNKESGFLSGFKPASNSDYQLERYGPPDIPKNFVPRHKFTAPLDVGNKLSGAMPPEVPPPEDNSLRLLIDGMATLVARCGLLFEDLSRQKNQSNPLFSFLFGGNGQDYYERKLWEERQKHKDRNTLQLNEQKFQSAEKMTAENRGRILGEKPLERSLKNSATSSSSADNVNLQFHLSDTFTTPISFSGPAEVVKPFQEDPAKQERFEQFLKEKYHGGLRSKDVGGSSKMSEASRARERLEFEAAAEAMEKGKRVSENKDPSRLFGDVLPTTGLQFTSGVLEQVKIGKEELVKESKLPKREEYPWRPSSLLCKRFDLTDPYMGKPPPPPRPRSKMDALILMPDPVAAAVVEHQMMPVGNQSSSLQAGTGDKAEGFVTEDIKVDAENIERPVDLYKAIFSDDSDAEDENNNPAVPGEDPEEKMEVANKTLNRLIAGDFLESLGKELGLEVPPDVPYPENRDRGMPSGKDSKIAYKGGKDMEQRVNDRSSDSAGGGNLMVSEMRQTGHEGMIHWIGRSNPETSNPANGRKMAEAGILERSGDENIEPAATKEEKKTKSATHQHNNSGSDSSEDERSRKRSHHRRRRSYSDSESSDSSDDSRRRSRSEGKRKRSSREKSSSRRHSKHHKHRHRTSSKRNSHYGSDKEHRKAKDRSRYKD